MKINDSEMWNTISFMSYFYYIMFLLILFFSMSCSLNDDEIREIKDNRNIKHESLIKNNFDTVVLDSCEYVYVRIGLGSQIPGYLAHKGTCKFCRKRDSILIDKIIKNNLTE